MVMLGQLEWGYWSLAGFSHSPILIMHTVRSWIKNTMAKTKDCIYIQSVQVRFLLERVKRCTNLG